MRRPLRTRIWFWKPQWHWFGPKTLLPFGTGGDEFDWHTIVLGWSITGRAIIAVRRCPGTGKCADLDYEMAEWPVDGNGHNHAGGPCKPNCSYCWVYGDE